MAINEQTSEGEPLSSWWKNSVILILVACFTVLIWLAAQGYRDAPPVPEKVLSPSGELVFTGEDIMAGQQVFLRYGLMENGTIWGHGAYLGPDFSAEYLHTLAVSAGEMIARQQSSGGFVQPAVPDVQAINAEVQNLLKQNRYDPETKRLLFTDVEAASFHNQIAKWSAYFSQPVISAGLPAKYITDPSELRQLTAFFAWTAWASAANRKGKEYSYTNNFPYEPLVGNTPPSDAVLWSALSLIALLGATAAVLFAFGKFNYLGWKGKGGHIHPQMVPGGTATEGQKATIKYFGVVALLFLVQTMAGSATAHYRVDPASFFGIDLSVLFPSNILRTWHLQAAVFWIATAFIAGGLFLAPALSGKEPEGQARGINILFGALIVVIAGSMLGELLGINQLFGRLWFWFGHQGWEYLDLGRAWQILLALGLLLWFILLFRCVSPALKNPERREVSSLFLYSAFAIPLFYLPAMFFISTTHFSVVDTWRFWIIHLWVEGFFEVFVTAMVATIFYLLGMVSHQTAARVVYLDAILYLGSGIIGTGHHWYWTGQSNVTLALAAVFSAMEVVPLTLLTLDAGDFIKLTRSKCDICGREISLPHKWTFYFLIAVGVWNFVGAGVFGFLINLPIVSYFEVGTVLTPNHAHTALMGVFGMLAMALLVFALRQTTSDNDWPRLEKFIRISFLGLNVGLAFMVITNLFPGGVLQFADVLKNGYWHARSTGFLHAGIMPLIEWLRMPADLVFICLGVIPMLIAVGRRINRGTHIAPLA